MHTHTHTMYHTFDATPSSTSFITILGLANEKFLSLVKGSLVLSEGDAGRENFGFDSFLSRRGNVVGEYPRDESLRSTIGVSALVTDNLIIVI